MTEEKLREAMPGKVKAVIDEFIASGRPRSLGTGPYWDLFEVS
jgi:hypothetical protein